MNTTFTKKLNALKSIFVSQIWLISLLLFYACGAPPQPSAERVSGGGVSLPIEQQTIDRKVGKETLNSGVSEAYSSLDLPHCDPRQVVIFNKSVSSISEYITEFLKGIEQIDLIRKKAQDDPLGLRRSQMMIFFGDGLIKRMSMMRHLSACRELQHKFYQSRRSLYLQAEKLSRSRESN